MTEAPRLAQPYLRVSTDDRGQRPERQLDLIQAWAKLHKVALLAPVVDEGTSASKTGPLERPKIEDAIERARQAKAQAIVVETGDRWSRQGIKPAIWAMEELIVKHGLELWFADLDFELQRGFGGEIVVAVNFGTAREFSKALSARTASGMAHAKSLGKKFGRPEKKLTADEMEIAARMRAKGESYRKVALALSDGRGAFDTTDVKLRKRRIVSAALVEREFKAAQKLGRTESLAMTEEAESDSGDPVSGQGEGA